jgi:hypothetical protein
VVRIDDSLEPSDVAALADQDALDDLDAGRIRGRAILTP